MSSAQDPAILEDLVSKLIHAMANQGVAILTPANLMMVMIKGMEYLEGIRTLTGPQKQQLLISAMQLLVEREMADASGVDIVLIKGVLDSPLTASIITAICNAARGKIGIQGATGESVGCLGWLRKSPAPAPAPAASP